MSLVRLFAVRMILRVHQNLERFFISSRENHSQRTFRLRHIIFTMCIRFKHYLCICSECTFVRTVIIILCSRSFVNIIRQSRRLHFIYLFPSLCVIYYLRMLLYLITRTFKTIPIRFRRHKCVVFLRENITVHNLTEFF